MITRREFLKLSLATGANLLIPWNSLGRLRLPAGGAPRALAPIPGGSLNPTSIPKYQLKLVIPPAMPQTSKSGIPSNIDYYEIAVRQFSQQILPPSLPKTTVWSYGSVNHPGTFNYPAFTLEAGFHRPARVKWINGLVDANGKFLPHLLPVDPTLHWANPPGGTSGRDTRPIFNKTPDRYTGPVPMVAHLHGGHSQEESDGYPEAWFLPAANNIPNGYARSGSHYDAFKNKFGAKFGVNWEPGNSVFQYQNDQRATTLWYHDHTLGMTRVNVYAGPAGFYLIRQGPGDLPDAVFPGPAPKVGADPFAPAYEIPIAIQDRSFNANGSLFYPDSRAFFDGFGGPYIPDTEVSPIWNPEFFGNTMVVNGRTWPYLEVEPRRYRFRLLNGCDSRFLMLKLVTNPLASRPANAALPFWQIGAEGGLLPKPVQLSRLLMGPAERADVVVDFSNAPVGTTFYLINEGPDEPFGGGEEGDDFDPADPGTTGQVMKFVVVPAASKDTSMPPARLTLPAFKPVGPSTRTRKVSLNEEARTFDDFDGPIAAMLGTLGSGGNPVLKEWHDAITENPALGATETWEIHNFTEDAHPIHIHQVQFQVVDRQPMDGGAARAPESWESGTKDTVVAYPGEITRVRALFDIPGLFVWHCHILEHEDNEMMRPYRVG